MTFEDALKLVGVAVADEHRLRALARRAREAGADAAEICAIERELEEQIGHVSEMRSALELMPRPEPSADDIIDPAEVRELTERVCELVESREPTLRGWRRRTDRHADLRTLIEDVRARRLRGARSLLS